MCGAAANLFQQGQGAAAPSDRAAAWVLRTLDGAPSPRRGSPGVSKGGPQAPFGRFKGIVKGEIEIPLDPPFLPLLLSILLAGQKNGK